MGKFGRICLAAAVIAGLAGCGSPQDDGTATDAAASAPTAEVAASDDKPAAFAQCAACHAIQPGKHGIGPSLAGVYGTKAGELSGYVFSEKLKASGLTWDDATLDKWLEAPMQMVPGTKMSFAGIKDAAKRKELIDYMKMLK